MPRSDPSKIGSTDNAEVEIVEAEPDDSAPAYESGPHLQDPENRAAKRAQMKAAGVTLDDENLTDDMRAILEEGD